MDALKQILHAIRLQPQMFQRHALTAPWQVEGSASNSAAWHLVESGGCYLQMGVADEPRWIAAGDLLVVTNTRHYQIRHSLTRPAEHSVPSHGLTTLISGEFRTEHNIVTPLFPCCRPSSTFRIRVGNLSTG